MHVDKCTGKKYSTPICKLHAAILTVKHYKFKARVIKSSILEGFL